MSRKELIEALERGETGASVDKAYALATGWRRLGVGWITPEGSAVLGYPRWSEHPKVGPRDMVALLRAQGESS